uniref:Movement protein TGB2 n=1 Tax=Ligustrum necrotic ringspot virus TaxID=478550 RepID=C8CJM5_9VIRU|nr:triple gene block protein 2 [Ligustrum necrotic ringspot virus]
MPLTPPANYIQVYVSAAIGVSLALIVGLATRNTLPIVGDLQHNLPHGGRYRDGTKSVDYFKPCKLNSVEGGSSWVSQPWLLVILLVAAVILLSKKPNYCGTCGRVH